MAACGSTSTATPTPKTASSASSTPTAAAVQTGNPSAAVTLSEAGSSLLYPYLQKLAPGINAAYPNITLTPAAGGSGTGQSEAISGTIDMGGSDAYLSPAQFTANSGILNIPIAVSSQAVNYNLAGVNNLKLSGSVLAQIYSGTITTWNNAAIAALNPGVTLPSTTIIPIRRSDSSGDTFIFTSFLSATNSTWSSGPAFGTTVNWPTVTGELTAQGNPAMVDTLKATPNGIAYIGISVESTALVDGLGEAELENQAGDFLQPNQTDVTAAVTAGAASVPANLAASLIYQSGAGSYPIVNFEYLVVNPSKITDTSTAEAIRTFIEWAISPTGGATSDNLAAVNFVPLPTNVVPLVNTALAQITG
ncbi:MAG: phosphate ABC transporter substrate-binding protein PstS [Candidatus Dormibacteria bacterium]